MSLSFQSDTHQHSRCEVAVPSENITMTNSVTESFSFFSGFCEIRLKQVRGAGIDGQEWSRRNNEGKKNGRNTAMTKMKSNMKAFTTTKQ